ncbi:EpsG family protein [Rosenbergiella collisarenosi]|uniref:EpsG family protein n=1 Tax=Rosenbergiella collisarenosi TaxID=1544695 RepID=UPI001F4FDB95|nr:EpsG family protein [Rosenbergiella collisarenosi]
MYPYWILAFIFIFLCVIDIYATGKNSKIIKTYIFFIAVTMLIVFAGIRGDGTGKDDLMYRDSFVQIVQNHHVLSLAQTIPIYKYEPLTTMLMYYIAYLTSNPSVFFLIYAFLTVSINAYTYKKFSNHYLTALAIYSSYIFIMKDLNQIRFGLSSSLFVLFLCLLHNNKIKSSIAIILSITAHLTAMAGLIMVPLRKVSQSKKLPYLIILISLPLGLIGGKHLFSSIFSYLPGAVNGYLNNSPDDASELSGGILSLINIKNFIFLVLFLYVWENDKDNNNNSLFYFLTLCFTIGISIRIVFSDFSVIGGRVSLLFLQVEPLLLAMTLSKIRIKKIYSLIFILFICTYYYYHDTIQRSDYIFGYSISEDAKII